MNDKKKKKDTRANAIGQTLFFLKVALSNLAVSRLTAEWIIHLIFNFVVALISRVESLLVESRILICFRRGYKSFVDTEPRVLKNSSTLKHNFFLFKTFLNFINTIFLVSR